MLLIVYSINTVVIAVYINTVVIAYINLWKREE